MNPGTVLPIAGTLLVLGALLVFPARSGAQIPPEIPLVPHLGAGARAMGMGGAYTAVSDDYEALAYNPAGLAQIRRVEFGGAIDHLSLKQENTFLGTRSETPLSKSNLQSLGFAYPIPTYRGSLVFGFSYDRERALDQDYFREGAGGPIVLERESMTSEGGVGAYRVGLAGDLSPELSVGIAGTVLAGSSTAGRTFDYQGDNGVDFERTSTTDDVDYTAVSGTLGAMVHTRYGLRFGLALFLPEKFELKRSGTTDIVRYQAQPTDTLDILEDFSTTDHVKLPFRVAGGLSYVPQGALRDFLFTVDATYADWSQITYNDETFRTVDRGYAYRSTVNLRVGAEYTFPRAPLRLRAGFISEPLAYQLIGTDVYMGEAKKAHFVSDRRYGTVGAGVLLEKSLTLDVAYVFGGYERTGSSVIGKTTEKQKERKTYIGAAFRL